MNFIVKQLAVMVSLTASCVSSVAYADDRERGKGRKAIPVNVKNAPDVNVVNTPDVNVVGTPGVFIENDGSAPVPVTVTDPVTINSGNTYRYVGNSTTTARGDQITGMHARCQTDFGPTARTCTTKEVFDTPVIPALANDFAWVQPVVAAMASDGRRMRYILEDGTLLFDPLELPSANGLNCGSWRNVSFSLRGTGIRSQGGLISVTVISCDQARPVACCLPQ